MKSSSFRVFPVLAFLALTFSGIIAVHAETELGNKMKFMGKSIKQLGRQLDDASKREDSAALTAKLVANAKSARELNPHMAEEIPETDRPKFVEGFRKKMDELIAQLEKLDAAVKEGRSDDAKALLKSLQTIKREGHREFSSDEE